MGVEQKGQHAQEGKESLPPLSEIKENTKSLLKEVEAYYWKLANATCFAKKSASLLTFYFT